MELLNVNDLLQNGVQYTFTFDFSILGLGPTGAADSIAQTLVSDTDLGGVYVTHPGLNPVGEETWITFIYLGPSNLNSVKDVATNIIQIVEANFVGATVTFTRAQGGASGATPAQAPAAPGSILDSLGLGSTNSGGLGGLSGLVSNAKWFAIAGVIILALVLAIKVS